jgi:hypothetical protein
MSEDFLSRWSRRKRAVREIEGADDAKVSDAVASAPAPEREPSDENARPPAADPAASLFDLKDLPSIESITATTDIRPFLAPGVPPELTLAALRRAWTADPTIRDFVGLADYDWDYHKPGSMAGFGPLEMTDDLRKAVARIIGNIPDENAASTAPASSQVAKVAQNTNDIKSEALASPIGPRDNGVAPPPVLTADNPDIASDPEHTALPTTADSAMQHQPGERKTIGSNIRRIHGRALPKS